MERLQISPVTGSIPRRSLLTGVTVGAGLAMAAPSLGAPAFAAPGAALAAEPAAFDWDTGNAAFTIVVSEVDPIILSYVGPSDATIILRLNALIATAMFDAVAPYHPTALGIYSNLGRRPSSEAATNRNKNIALTYATYRVFLAHFPMTAAPKLRAIMAKYGLDPDDTQENTTSPIGIGNLAAKGVLAARSHDGSNMMGDVDWGPYNRMPYRDYTGYQPVNTAYELRDPSRWQPSFASNGGGTFKIQRAVTPHFTKMAAYTFGDVRQYLLAPPRDSDYRNNRRGYRAQAEILLDRSAALTDEKKAKAEIFNDKIYSLGLSVGLAAANAGLGFDEILHLNLVTAIAAFDAVIACWYNKFVYDAVRPFSAINFLFARERVTAWGGPGKGTVTDLLGAHWTSYLKVADHPEYPSGSATICAAHSQAARRYFGTDAVDLTYYVGKGSFQIEPGVSPATDLALHFSSWTEFALHCRESRIDGGVHFPAASNAGGALGTQFGDLAFSLVSSHIDGRVAGH